MSESAPSPIKGWLSGKADAIAGRVKRMVAAHIGRNLRWLPDYVRWLTTVVTSFPQEVNEFALEVNAAMHRLGDVLFHPETGHIPSLQRRLDRHLDRLEDIEGRAIPSLSDRVTNLRQDLFADVPMPNRGWVWRLGEAIDSLRERLFNEATGAIRILQRQMEGVQEDATQLRVGRIVPLEQSVSYIEGVELPNLSGHIGTALRRVEGVEGVQSEAAPYMGAMIALWSAPAFRTAMETLAENEPKLKRQCQLDLDEVDDLFGYVPFPLNLALIMEVVAVGAVTAGIVAELSEQILNGETILG